MIINTEVKNFKTIKEYSFEFKNLNILTGINGTGKSSLIQALLCLRQTYLEKENFDSLLLKDKSGVLKIGTGKDVLNTEREPIGFPISIKLNFKNKKESFFCYDYLRKEESGDMYKNLNSLRKNELSSIDMEIIKQSLFLRNDNFHYVSADRIGPSEEYLLSDNVKQFQEIGHRGEFAVHYLNEYKSKAVENTFVLHEKTKEGKYFLENQISLWLSEIMSGVKISTSLNENGTRAYADYTVGESIKFKPANIGFGVSYVLPVILALLTAKVGGTVIIENPESHLHPRGQSKMAELIARCAASGVQIFIETQSDHIITGIMIAAREYFKAKKENRTTPNGISHDDVAIYYFSRENESNSSKVERVDLLETGKIPYPPKGFFDQFNIDMKRLLK
ncbi:MAG: DUF3696 domain-containing protein [Leptospiraceae bacterium]|nr:DUF3696 domain-containing protein [Leptospiraceae bacterium]